MSREDFIKENMNNLDVLNKAFSLFGIDAREVVLGKLYDYNHGYSNVVLVIEDSGAGYKAWSYFSTVSDKHFIVKTPSDLKKGRTGNGSISHVPDRCSDSNILYLFMPDTGGITITQEISGVFKGIEKRIQGHPNKKLVYDYIGFESLFYISDTFSRLKEVQDFADYFRLREAILHKDTSVQLVKSLEKDCSYYLEKRLGNNPTMFITKDDIATCYKCISHYCDYDYKNILHKVFDEYLQYNTKLGRWLSC